MSAKFEFNPYKEKCKTAKVASPYYCNKYGASLCVVDSGNFSGPPYPSLMNKWTVDLTLFSGRKAWEKAAGYQGPYPIPGPKGGLYLKVGAEICFANENRKTIARQSQDSPYRDCECVKYNEKYGSEYVENPLENHNCHACPQGSDPRMFGYFCESCPAGFEPHHNWEDEWGCKPCKDKYFKAQPGNDDCEGCPYRTCTNGTGSTSCFVNPDDGPCA